MPDTDYNLFIRDHIDETLKSLNEKIKEKFVDLKNKELVPTFTKELSESVMHHHDDDLKQCRCKFLIAPVSATKGLTVQTVYYLRVDIAEKAEIVNRCRECNLTTCFYG